MRMDLGFELIQGVKHRIDFLETPKYYVCAYVCVFYIEFVCVGMVCACVVTWCTVCVVCDVCV